MLSFYHGIDLPALIKHSESHLKNTQENPSGQRLKRSPANVPDQRTVSRRSHNRLQSQTSACVDPISFVRRRSRGSPELRDTHGALAKPPAASICSGTRWNPHSETPSRLVTHTNSTEQKRVGRSPDRHSGHSAAFTPCSKHHHPARVSDGLQATPKCPRRPTQYNCLSRESAS